MPRFLIPILLLPVLVSCVGTQEPEELSSWKARGDTLVAHTFDTLRNTLLRAVGEKGFPGAVDFCNTRAIALTHTFTEEGTLIKRTSGRLRNPQNAPDTMETRILSMWEDQKKNNLPLADILFRNKEKVHYFKPILIQSMCLNCHGQKNAEIKPDTWEILQQKYPGDSAFGYKEGDLRGAWHISFAEPKK